MKIVYFGTDVFLSCFDYFLREHQILALYTYHNEEDYFTEYSITKKAKHFAIPVHYKSISPEEIIRYFTEEDCDLFFIAEYNRILTLPENLPQFRGINVHSSLLPQGRSYYPIESAMEHGLLKTGVTLHKVTAQLDMGDILAQRSIRITDEMDSIDIYLRCAFYARKMLEDIIKNFDKYWAEAKSQCKKNPYWQRPDSKLMTLHHEMCQKEALAMFRKYNSMVQVKIDEKWFHVTMLTTSKELLQKDTFLSISRVLYPVEDGHLRLHIHPMEESL